MRRCLLLLLLFLLCSCSAANSPTADRGISLSEIKGQVNFSGERRLALVIGNSAYRYSGALANPAKDAQLIAKSLREVGFELHGGDVQLNLNRRSLDQAIESFGDAIRPGDVALFYYSGHGMQVAGENYLVPVDANIKKESEVRVKTVPVNLLFAKLDGIPKAINIVVLDACRNNPFARSFRSSGGGLASVSAPTGTIVAFSTAPGQVAEDGHGDNSTYTAALARYVKEPGLSVEGVFKKVRSVVTGATGGSQTPWENTSLVGNFHFIDGDLIALKKAALAAAGKSKSAELERLLRIERESKEKEQAEIARRESELAAMDARIAAMKSKLGPADIGKNGAVAPSKAGDVQGQCEVLGVIDGDTLSLSCPDFKGEINVAGIDAPEKGQPYWQESKIQLASYVRTGKVSFEFDRGKKKVTILLSGGKNLSSLMVMDGLAWSLDRKNSQGNYLLNIERIAKKKRRNVWSDSGVVSPWAYRKAKKIPADSSKSYGLLSNSYEVKTGGRPAKTYSDCEKLKDKTSRYYCKQKVSYHRREEEKDSRKSCFKLKGEKRIDCYEQNSRILKKIRERYK